MKIDKKIKEAYKALPLPKAEDVLPEAAFGEEKRERKLLRPVIYAVAAICLCVVIGVIVIRNLPQKNIPVVVKKSETTYAAYDRNYPSFEPPMWIHFSLSEYAIVEITDVYKEEVYEEYVDFLDDTVTVTRKFYTFEYIYSYSGDKNIEFVMYEKIGETDIEINDILLINISKKIEDGNACAFLRLNKFGDPGFVRIENGSMYLGEDTLELSALNLISAVNEYIYYRDKYGVIDSFTPDYGDPTPSIPAKKLSGTVTVEELIEFFEAVKIAVDEWWVWRNTLTNVSI